MDTFGISGVIKFLLVVRTLAPLAIAGISIWAVTDGGLGFENPALGWGAAAAMIAYAIYNASKLMGLQKHEVGLSETEVRVGDKTLAWKDVESAEVHNAFQMETAIAIKPFQGEPLEIKAATRNLPFILTAVKKHVEKVNSPA